MASALQVPGAHEGTGSRPGLWVSGPCGEVGRGLLLCWTGSAVQGTQSGSLVLSCQGTSACALTPGGRLCGRGAGVSWAEDGTEVARAGTAGRVQSGRG